MIWVIRMSIGTIKATAQTEHTELRKVELINLGFGIVVAIVVVAQPYIDRYIDGTQDTRIHR